MRSVVVRVVVVLFVSYVRFSIQFQEAKKKFPDNFRLDYALSREQENKKGGKMYIQDKVEEYADEIFSKLDNGAHIYFCGLKGTFLDSFLFRRCLTSVFFHE